MARSVTSLDFNSEENVILLNPRWPTQDSEVLRAVAESTIQERKLTGHFFIATSGSTADSLSSIKLVALKKEAVRNSAASVNRHLKSMATDKWAQVLPTFHVGGLGIEARALLSGAQVVTALKDFKWDPEYFYKILKNEQITLSALVPTQVHDLVTAGFQAPANLRAVVVGGGAFDEALYFKAREKGWPVLPSYGMTETCSQIATSSFDSLKENKYPAITLLEHAQARSNDEGFIEVSSNSLFTCYARQTSDGIQSWDSKVNDWFTTEDRGEVIDGSLRITGRNQDYIKIGGEATNTARLREILQQCVTSIHPQGAHQITLLDVKSERLGAEIHLVSTLNNQQTEAIVQAFTEKVLPFEKVRKIHYLNEIPRSDLGKILWGELRKRLS